MAFIIPASNRSTNELMCVGEKDYIPHKTFKEQKGEISAELLSLYSLSLQTIYPTSVG